MKTRVICIGEVVSDLTYTGKYLRLSIGGAPLNVAVGLKRMGLKPQLITTIGDDWFGRQAISFIRREGVSSQIEAIKAVPTRISIVSNDIRGERSFSFIPGTGADEFISRLNFNTTWLDDVDAIYYGTLPFCNGQIPEAFVKFLEEAKKRGIVRFFDPNLRLGLFKSAVHARKITRDLLQYADILKLNILELSFLTSKKLLNTRILDGIAEKYLQSGLYALIVTKGKSGSSVWSESGMAYVPSISVKSVDTTACGDAFMAALIAGFLDKSNMNKSWVKILNFANAAGALCSMRYGSADSVPTYAETLKFLNKSRK
ncbi:MAG: carbohydrate kinase family protein [Candidatus Kryptoniota bacterium]